MSSNAGEIYALERAMMARRGLGAGEGLGNLAAAYALGGAAVATIVGVGVGYMTHSWKTGAAVGVGSLAIGVGAMWLDAVVRRGFV